MTVHESPPDDRQRSEASQSLSANRQQRIAKSTTVGGAALAILLAVYAVAQPVLNERLGWQLPGIQQSTQDGGTAVAEKADRISEVKRSEATPGPVVKPSDLDDSRPKTGTGPLANARPKEPTRPPADASLLHGILSDLGNDRFMSPAGLMYGPGSQEGHRLKHVERHTVDDPDRPGSHGVFDGGMPGALAMIDKAYRKAKTGVQTSKQEEDERIIYTVDIGSRVGYVGGSNGRRRNNPMARRVRLVLERNRVITAYPM